MPSAARRPARYGSGGGPIWPPSRTASGSRCGRAAIRSRTSRPAGGSMARSISGSTFSNSWRRRRALTSAMPCWTNGRRTGGRRSVEGRCDVAVAASSVVRRSDGALSQAPRAAVAGATLAAPHRRSCFLPPCGGGPGRGGQERRC